MYFFYFRLGSLSVNKRENYPSTSFRYDYGGGGGDPKGSRAFFAEQDPACAYGGSSKNLKVLRNLRPLKARLGP